MKSWLRRIRGALGVGLTWATGWGLFGGALWLVRGAWEIAFSAGLTYAATGFVGGTVFAAMLRLMEGQRRFDQLRISRFAAWGALGGLLIGAGDAVLMSILWPSGDYLWGQFIAITTFLGAGSAAGSLAMARIAEDRGLLEESARAADVGLSREERHHLLGEPEVTTD